MENLRSNQRQLDADGCEVGVSRQALEEALDLIPPMDDPADIVPGSTIDLMSAAIGAEMQRQWLAAKEADPDASGPVMVSTVLLARLAAEAIGLPEDGAVAKGGWLKLTPAEVQSGRDRVRWAEGLIRQLPEGHEGRNSWLLNWGQPSRG